MDKEEILFLRNMLLDRRSSIIDRVKKLADAWHELEERAIEIEEEAQKASIAKPYNQLDGNGKLEIEQIDLALTKITVGEFGICESCGDDISPKRLEVIPWARLCVDCAREYEKMHKTLPRTAEAPGTAKIPDDYQGLSNEQIVNAINERFQADERIETDELKIAFRKGILYLAGAVQGEAEHDLILQTLTDVMGFSDIVDHIDTGEISLDQDEFEERSLGNPGAEDGLFYDRDDLRGDLFESKARDFPDQHFL